MPRPRAPSGGRAASSLAAPRFRPTPSLGSRTHVLPCLEPPAGRVFMARDRPARRRPGRRLCHARERHHRPRPLVRRRGCGLCEHEPARPRRAPCAPSASRAPARTAAARARRDGPRADPLLHHAPTGTPAAAQRASLRALAAWEGRQERSGPPMGSGPRSLKGGPQSLRHRHARRASYSAPGSPLYCHGPAWVMPIFSITRIDPGLDSNAWAYTRVTPGRANASRRSAAAPSVA
jgi:hypothetical protein